MKKIKRLTVLLISIAITNLTYAQSNILLEGNSCFAKGDYNCAITKYKIALNSVDVRQKKIAGDNLRQAEKCLELRKIADAAFNDKNFVKAKEFYVSILNENPSDEYARTKLNDIKEASITLSVSKSALLFSNFGGKEIIYVTTNADSYAIGVLPSWCTIQKFEKSFSVICSQNISDTARIGSFIIKVGGKSEIINMRQSKEQAITLSVSMEKIIFNSTGGNSDQILVYTNASNYSVSFLQSWCSIQTYNDYLIVTCTNNDNTKMRSDWFKIIAENKEVKIYVTQAGNTNTKKKNSNFTLGEKKIKYKYFFMNFGVVSNDLEKIENVMITVGRAKIYARLKFNPKMLINGNSYSTKFLSNELEITNTGKVKNFPSASGYYYVVSNQIANNRQSVTLGTSFGGKNIRFYLAGGYGERHNLWGLNLRSYNSNQNEENIWAKNINQTLKGIEAEGGLFLKLGSFNIMGGASMIFDSKQGKSFIDCHLGLGFSKR